MIYNILKREAVEELWSGTLPLVYCSQFECMFFYIYFFTGDSAPAIYLKFTDQTSLAALAPLVLLSSSVFVFFPTLLCVLLKAIYRHVSYQG